MTDNSGKRKTLSLKIDANYKDSVKRSSNGNNNFGIEIKKRRRRGLAIDINNPEKSYSNTKQNSNISSKLTDKEFKVRVKVLQEALNKEQQEKQAENSSKPLVNDTKYDININNEKQNNTDVNNINDNNKTSTNIVSKQDNIIGSSNENENISKYNNNIENNKQY